MQTSLSQLSVLPPRSRAEQLADTLAEHIRARGLQPGEQLGTLDEVRAEVGFARTTVSEAVRLLRERGVLEIRPGRGGGLFVAAETPVVRMRHTLLTAGESPESGGSVREAIALREALEESVAIAAATACTPQDATQLRAAAAALSQSGADFEEFLRRNWQLHELIAALCPNKMMSAVYVSCLGYLSRSQSRYDDDGAVAAYIEARAAVHVELVEAILAAEPSRIRAAVLAHNHQHEEKGPQ